MNFSLLARFILDVLVLHVSLYYANIYTDIKSAFVLRERRLFWLLVPFCAELGTAYVVTCALGIQGFLLSKKPLVKRVLKLASVVLLVHPLVDSMQIAQRACANGGRLFLPATMDQDKIIKPVFVASVTVLIQSCTLFMKGEGIAIGEEDIKSSLAISILSMAYGLSGFELQSSHMRGQHKKIGIGGMFNPKLFLIFCLRVSEVGSRFLSLGLFLNSCSASGILTYCFIEILLLTCHHGCWELNALCMSNFTETDDMENAIIQTAPRNMGLLLSVFAFPFFNPRAYSGVQSVGCHPFCYYPRKLITLFTMAFFIDWTYYWQNLNGMIVILLSLVLAELVLLPMVLLTSKSQHWSITSIGGVSVDIEGLVDAASVGNSARVEQCLEAGVPVNEYVHFQQNYNKHGGAVVSKDALHGACEVGDIEIVRMLLDARANPNLRWERSTTYTYFDAGNVEARYPLDLAAPWPEICDLLRERGASSSSSA